MQRVVGIAFVVLLAAGCFSGGSRDEPTAPTHDLGYTPAPQPSYPADGDLAQVGRWEAPFEGDVPAVNMVLLHDGRLLYWSGVEAALGQGPTDITFVNAAPVNASSRVLDLSGPTPVVITPINPEGAASDLFCAGQTILPDGRVLAVGSSLWTMQPTLDAFLYGGTDARIFDPATDTWERKADMHWGRWYPSLILLADGTPLVASGIQNLIHPDTQVQQLETYDVEKDEWREVQGANRLLPLYPRLTVLPGGDLKGDLFYNTVGTLWGPFGEHPLQALWSFQQHMHDGTWSYDGLSSYGARQHAASIMLTLDPADDYTPRMVTFGGTLQQGILATPFTEFADLSGPTPVNSVLPAMAYPRWHHNGVLLPDGSVLAIGGGLYDNVVAHGQPNIPVLPAEQWDPTTQAWTTLSSMSVPRMYHSTAVLLPDGRVLVGGHVPLPNPSPTLRDTYNPQIVETRFQVFDPPYLFRGERPEIITAPDELAYGAGFNVTMSDMLQQLDGFVLVRPGATTHAFDADQRAIKLEVTRTADHYELVAPPDGTVAPPGYYMLFALGHHDAGAIPSVAAFIHLS